MRLIDADEILKILKEHAKSFIPNYEEDNYEAGVLEGLALAECEVNETPTVEERKHGHWSEEDYRCSVCGAKRPTTDTASKWIYLDQHYCYNCGAAMDEEEENK